MLYFQYIFSRKINPEKLQQTLRTVEFVRSTQKEFNKFNKRQNIFL